MLRIMYSGQIPPRPESAKFFPHIQRTGENSHIIYARFRTSCSSICWSSCRTLQAAVPCTPTMYANIATSPNASGGCTKPTLPYSVLVMNSPKLPSPWYKRLSLMVAHMLGCEFVRLRACANLHPVRAAVRRWPLVPKMPRSIIVIASCAWVCLSAAVAMNARFST